MLAKTISDNQKEWDQHIPKLMIAYRTTIHESKGCTPFHVTFVRSPVLPVDKELHLPYLSLWKTDIVPLELFILKSVKELRHLITTTKVGMTSTQLTYTSVLVIKYGSMSQLSKLTQLRNCLLYGVVHILLLISLVLWITTFSYWECLIRPLLSIITGSNIVLELHNHLQNTLHNINRHLPAHRYILMWYKGKHLLPVTLLLHRMVHQEERIQQVPLLLSLDPNGHTVFPKDLMILFSHNVGRTQAPGGEYGTVSVFNVHSFRCNAMLGIYEDYDISLIRE